MQTYLPLFKALLSEWSILTLNNPLYAAALAATVWLLTAMLYGIRIAGIKRTKAASEKSSAESVNALQQQLQQRQEELAEAALQLEKAKSESQAETQRALALEQLIAQRNKRIAETIQSLARSFDLGERPLLAGEDLNADSLWQQHDKVINQLTERLHTELQAKIDLQKTCQAETAKLAEKETLLEALQTTLTSHSNQLAKLEQALEEQRSILQQQNHDQQLLSAALKNYPSETTRPAPQEQPVNVRQQSMPMEASSNTADIPLDLPLPAELHLPLEPGPKIEDDLTAQASQDKPINEQPQIAPQAEPATPEAVFFMPPSVDIESEIEENPSVPVDDEQHPATPAKGSLGKLKSLFGKPTKEKQIKTEPRWTFSKSDKKALSEQSDDEAKNNPGKLKNLYSKFSPKAK